MRNIFAVGMVVGAALVGATGVAMAQGTSKSTVVAQASPPAQAKSAAQSVATLAGAGYSVVGSMAGIESKQNIVIMQKASDVFFCPVWVNNLGPAAGACARAQ